MKEYKLLNLAVEINEFISRVYTLGLIIIWGIAIPVSIVQLIN